MSNKPDPSRSPVWRRTRDFIGAQVEDSLVILGMERAAYFSFNASANAIWDALETPVTVPQIADILMSRFDVERAVCIPAIERVLASLSSSGLAQQVAWPATDDA